MISPIEKLVKNFSKINSVSKSKRNGSAFKRNVIHFMENVNTLFDIFCKNNSQRRKLEKDKLLRMSNTDFTSRKTQIECGWANKQGSKKNLMTAI